MWVREINRTHKNAEKSLNSVHSTKMYTTVVCLFLLFNNISTQTADTTTTEPSEMSTTLATEAQEFIEENDEDVNANAVVALNSLGGQGVPQGADVGPLANNNKKIPIFFQKITDNKFIKPISEKISTKFAQISDYLNHPNNPTYGVLQKFSPQNVWEKINKKGGLLAGPNAAVYGFGHSPNPDYPFAYRKSRTLREDLKNYKDPIKQNFHYYDYSKYSQFNNASYKFPFVNSNSPNNSLSLHDSNNKTVTVATDKNNTIALPVEMRDKNNETIYADSVAVESVDSVK